MAELSRRALLGGIGGVAVIGGAAALVQTDVLPGRVRAWRQIERVLPDGVPPSPEPGGPTAGTGSVSGAASVERGAFFSVARNGVRAGWVLITPGGGAVRPGLPVVVALHGHGADETMLLGLRAPELLTAAIAAGVPPFAVASVAGGNGYWHPRHDGTDSAATVLDEFLPMLARRGLRTTSGLGLLGWSMGGYGALRLAGLLGPSRVAAVVACSPALWRSPGESAPGAFDDAEDFRREDVFAARTAIARVPLRVDCGLGDPFLAAARAFVAGVTPRPEGGFQPGGHDGDYWRRRLPDQLAFLGRHLAT